MSFILHSILVSSSATFRFASIMITSCDTADYIGILPSKANVRVGTVDQGEAVLNIAASFIRALDYHPPLFTQDPTLHKAILHTLESWNIGDAVNGFMNCVDVGVAAAEAFFSPHTCVPSLTDMQLFYPSHEFDLKIVIAICTA